MTVLANTDSISADEFSLSVEDRVLSFSARGDWTLASIGKFHSQLQSRLDSLDYDNVDYDFSRVENMDTSGAYILAKAIRCQDDVCFPYQLTGNSRGQKVLMREAAEASMGRMPRQPRQWYDTLVRIGESSERFLAEVYDTFVFLGQFMTVLFRQILTPHTIRWKSVVAHIEDVGLNAAPIIMTLSFFIGAVIAYMGANLLASLGFQIFIVELIGISVLREFAVIITAILLAGRSDSAFTAQIGAMKMRQEIDAMQVIGLDRFETLVIPRAIACVISAPVLTFLAMISGMGGGLLVAWLGPTDISPILFFARMQETVSINHFWVGIVKAPVFALIIAIIGCRQGLAVTGSVESLGSRTTKSVVQAIFAVIAVDAVFAILFFEMGV